MNPPSNDPHSQPGWAAPSGQFPPPGNPPGFSQLLPPPPPPPPSFQSTPFPDLTPSTPEPKRSRNGLIIGAICLVGLLLFGGVLATILSARSKTSSDNQTTATTLSQTPPNTALDPRVKDLDKLDIDSTDAINASVNGTADALIRSCNDMPALDGVPLVTPGRSISTETFSAASITGEFPTAAEAKAWFDQATNIAKGCTFDHGQGTKETILDVIREDAPNKRIVRIIWKVDASSGRIVGEDDYVSSEATVGVVNCQGSQGVIDQPVCDQLRKTYLNRFDKRLN